MPTNNFPTGAGEPELDEKRGATSFTLLLALTSKDKGVTSLPILTRMAEELSDRLRNAAGTEIVRVFGELNEEITVDIDSQQLSTAGLSLQQVSQMIAQADPKLPAGMLRGKEQDVRLQVAEELQSLEAIRNIPIRSNQSANFLRLSDIARIDRGWQQPENDIALVNGERVVFVAARMQPTVRVDTWTANTKTLVEAFNREFGGSVQAELVFVNKMSTLRRVLVELTQNLVMGSLVVMLVVMIFMGIRASWIVGLSLPLCAAFAIFSLSFYGEQIHQMSIFGMIIALGLLIDNAIVITDEIRANLQDAGLSRLDALVKAIRHLFSPLLASTLTTIFGLYADLLVAGEYWGLCRPHCHQCGYGTGWFVCYLLADYFGVSGKVLTQSTVSIKPLV